MSNRMVRLCGIGRFLHHNLLAIIVLAYAMAALAPGPGLLIRDVGAREIAVGNAKTAVSLPAMLLGFLLFSAGIRVQSEQIGRTLRRPKVLVVGLLANLGIPLGYLALVAVGLRYWHSVEEARTLLLGLGLVASMPIAGSSTGWAQNLDADLSVSLGLVLLSTLLSPLTTPVALRSVGFLSQWPHAAQLDQLTGQGTAAFLIAWVMAPSCFGILVRFLLGENRVSRASELLKVASILCLVLLCYSNAAVCLPAVVRKPDWDFLGLTLLLVAGLCILAFVSGSLIGRVFDADRSQRIALMFGLGMNNNGTGLVLASTALGANPLAILPIILYNLVQHIAAGCVAALTVTRQAAPESSRRTRFFRAVSPVTRRAAPLLGGARPSPRTRR